MDRRSGHCGRRFDGAFGSCDGLQRLSYLENASERVLVAWMLTVGFLMCP